MHPHSTVLNPIIETSIGFWDFLLLSCSSKCLSILLTCDSTDQLLEGCWYKLILISFAKVLPTGLGSVLLRRSEVPSKPWVRLPELVNLTLMSLRLRPLPLKTLIGALLLSPALKPQFLPSRILQTANLYPRTCLVCGIYFSQSW